MRVLFVCTGNTCRSPLAEAIARHVDTDGNEYASAGRHAQVGEPAAANAVAIAPELATHRARQLTPELEAWADRVVDLNEAGIRDPYGGDEETYRATAAELEQLIRFLALQRETVSGTDFSLSPSPSPGPERQS